MQSSSLTLRCICDSIHLLKAIDVAPISVYLMNSFFAGYLGKFTRVAVLERLYNYPNIFLKLGILTNMEEKSSDISNSTNEPSGDRISIERDSDHIEMVALRWLYF